MHEPTPIDLNDPRLYRHREVSWLEFNARVLALAGNEQVPLLERCKFLAIFASNLDEFFMVRVAAAMDAYLQERAPSTPDQMPRLEVLERVSETVRGLVAEHSALWRDEIHPALSAEGILIRTLDDLDDTMRREALEAFHRQVLPALTPLAVGPGLPFPYISGLSLNLGLRVRDPSTDETRFARVKVPPAITRLFPVGDVLIPVEDLMQTHIGELFPGMQIMSSMQFRVTRDADFDIAEDADDLLGAVEDQLRRRRFGHAVRLEVRDDTPVELREEVTAALELEERDVYTVPGMLDLTCLWTVAGLDRPDLSYPRWVPRTPPRLTPSEPDGDVDMFEVIRSGDLLVHHPYDDFTTSVEKFVLDAVDDPDVLAIKQTVYRAGSDSPIVSALVRAAERGIQTVCLVEVKARFDEQRNIDWARNLERAGVHVVYGFPGLKTHSKMCLIVRREGDMVRRYCHLGTGNYNASTAALYTDVGIFTCREELTRDVSDLFNHITGFGRQPDYTELLVAPLHIRSGLISEIERVTAAHRQGTPGRIVMKMNALIDGPVMKALYRASQAGVSIDLIVRSIVGLRPGIPGVSENIRVTSVVGRFLEHSRIFSFRSGDHTRVWIGSADMMVRNLDHRIETITPVDDPVCARELDLIMATILADTELAWRLDPEGNWYRVEPTEGTPGLNCHDELMRRTLERAGEI